MREVFWPWLVEHQPGLVARYERLYRGSDATRAYRDEVCAFVAARRAQAWRRHGRPRAPSHWRGLPDDRRSPVASDPEVGAPAGGGAAGPPAQLSLL